jgi:phosphoserine phosphatase
MHVVTLISARNDPRVSRSLAEQAQYIIGEAEMFWLERDTACDLVTEDAPDAATREALSRLALSAAVDCAVQPVAGRRKSILIADMDSTMIDQECIDELAAEIGLKDKVAAITARAMNGEIAFEPALRERVALLRDLPVARVSDVLATRIQLATGGATLVATMRANGAYTALVSGGFTLFTQEVARQLGFDENRANRLDVTDGVLTGTVAEPILGADSKLAALHEIASARGADAGDVLAVGDGANDLPMILAAGTGVALHAKPAVAAKAPFRVDHSDLTGLLFLQGYKAEQFIAA